MKNLDVEHVLFWMDAIRDSSDRYRTLESFWKGQIRSKIWLIENISKFIDKEVSFEIHGGWNGILASLLFQSNLQIKHITNIDIDPVCKPIAEKANQIELEQGQFTHIVDDITNYKSKADVVINTSCEHLTQTTYNNWIEQKNSNCLLVLQSNNYEINEHVRIARSIEEFKKQSAIKCYDSKTLDLPLYSRYMLIGSK